MFKKRISLICLTVLLATVAVFGLPKPTKAGFGISPPYLKNQQLTPGSKFEQQIMLLRSSAEEELKAEIKVNAPEIASWITIDKGNEFALPKDQVQVPMTVVVNVPKGADLGNYKGSINIKITSPKEKPTGVAIALGARVDIDLTLTNVANADFIVRVAAIKDFELLKWPWNLPIFAHFLHRVPVTLNIENIGNIKTAPSKITLDISDITKSRQLAALETNDIEEVDAFSTKEITAYMPTKLQDGQYWGKLKIYKGSSIVNSYEIAFTIAKPGTLPGGGPKLGLYPYILLGIYTLILIIILTLLIYFRSWRLIGKSLWLILLVLYQPIKPLIRKSREVATNLRHGFWRWIGSKASEYHNTNNTSNDKYRKRK